MNEHSIGSYIRLEAKFTVNKLAVTPTAVFLFVMPPDGTILSYNDKDLTKDGTGVAYKDIIATDWGMWRYRFESSGTVISAEENAFIVKPSLFKS